MTAHLDVEQAALVEEIERLGPWFHNLRLPGGVQTAPDHALGDFPGCMWQHIAPHVPADLTGWTVLDIGCNAGYYSMELARRGAEVTGLDVDPRYLEQARWAASLHGLSERIDFQEGNVYALARTDRTWDLVVFMGVLYHLRYPLLALDAVASRVGRLLVFQTLMMPGAPELEDTQGRGLDDREELTRPGWPRMAFLEHAFQDDPTNWWAPDRACVAALLRSAGLEVTRSLGEEVHLCRPRRERGYRALEEMTEATGGGAWSSSPSSGDG